MKKTSVGQGFGIRGFKSSTELAVLTKTDWDWCSSNTQQLLCLQPTISEETANFRSRIKSQ